MIQTASDFIKYFESIRCRTMNYIHAVPVERVDWSPKDGEFTCGDIIRHCIQAEKMFVRVAMEGQWKYEDHKEKKEDSLANLIAFLETVHTVSMEKLKGMSEQDFSAPRAGPKGEGQPIPAWRWLMVMAEHEIHHRSQLAVYLSLMGVQPPHIFGLGVEDLIALSVT